MLTDFRFHFYKSPCPLSSWLILLPGNICTLSEFNQLLNRTEYFVRRKKWIAGRSRGNLIKRTCGNVHSWRDHFSDDRKFLIGNFLRAYSESLLPPPPRISISWESSVREHNFPINTRSSFAKNLREIYTVRIREELYVSCKDSVKNLLAESTSAQDNLKFFNHSAASISLFAYRIHGRH